MIKSTKQAFKCDRSNKNYSQDLDPGFVSTGPVFLLTMTSKDADQEKVLLESHCASAGLFLAPNENNNYDLDHKAFVRNTLGLRHTAAII